MKKSGLRQLIREEIKKSYLKEGKGQDLAYPLESAMARVNIYDLDDIKSINQFNDLVKAMEKTGEVPTEFFALKAEEQMRIISQAIMFI